MHRRMQKTASYLILNRYATGLRREEKYRKPYKSLGKEEEKCPYASTLQPF